MDYPGRLQAEVDHIIALCEEAEVIQQRLTAAINRLDSLELERQGYGVVSLHEMRDIDGVNYKDWRDFVRQTGPYEPTVWGGHEDPVSVQKQINGRRDAARRWERDLSTPGFYPTLLDCLAAARHIDPKKLEIEIPDHFTDEEGAALKLLASVDMARENLDLPLPLPGEVAHTGYYRKVQKLIFTVLKSRMEVEQQSCFLKGFLSNQALCQRLGMELLTHIVCNYIQGHRVDGYVDLTPKGLSALAQAFSGQRDKLYWQGFKDNDIALAIDEAVSVTAEIPYPASKNLKALVSDVANDNRLNELLKTVYRTTDDWHRRHPQPE